MARAYFFKQHKQQIITTKKLAYYTQYLLIVAVVVVVVVPPIYPIPNTVLRRTYPDPNPDRMPPVVCLREVLVVVSFLRRVYI